MHDPIAISVLSLIVLLFAIGVAIYSFKRYEVLVFLVALSPLISALFITDTQSASEEGIGSYLRVSIMLFAGLVGIIQFFRLRQIVQEKIPIHLTLMGMFLLLTLLSTTYSLDKYYTFIRSFSFIAFFGFLIGLHYWLQDRHQVDKVLHTFFLFVFICTILNALSIVIFPERAWDYYSGNRFRGLWAHPNMMGVFCMSSYPVLLWKYSRSNSFGKWAILIFVSLIAIFHILSGSRSTIFVSVFSISVWFFVLKYRIKLVFFILVCLSGLLIMTSTTAGKYIKRDTEYGESFTTLTGRDEIWNASYLLIKDKPIFGYGYGVEGKVFEDARFYNPVESLWRGSARTSLHNGYITIVIGVGIVGFTVWLLLLYIPLRRTMLLLSDTYKAFVIAIITACLLENFVESSIVGGTTLASVFFWIVWVLLGRLQYISESEKFKQTVKNTKSVNQEIIF